MNYLALDSGIDLATTKANRLRFVFLFVALAVFLTFSLGQRGLTEPDEGRYAGMALEMLEPDSSLWEPQASDFYHYDKPPLIYWVTAVSLQCFGRNEIAARLPSVLGAMLSLAGLCWAAWRLYSREIAWWSVLICGTLGQFWVLARFLSPDMLLTGFCTMAIAAWAESRHRNAHLGFWFLSLLFWTFAWWTKATPTLVPLLGLIAAIFITKDVAGKKALRPWRTILALLALGSPWYLLMMFRHPELVHFFFGHELVGRIANDEHGRHKPIYFFLLANWLLWFPWLPALALLAIFKQKQFALQRWKDIRAKLSSDGWIVVVGLLIFSLNSSKLLTYTLPLAPWLALLLGRIIVRAKTFLAKKTFQRIAFGVPAILVLLAIAAVIVWPRYESRLGKNSSMLGVARHLQSRNASTVLMDQYWPGMEFYFGENVYYVSEKTPQETRGDTGFCHGIGDSHFVATANFYNKVQKLPSSGVWLVRYMPQKHSIFTIANFPVLEREIIGNFELLRIN